ncbi:MAG TPA: hypothetical protein PKL77_08900 [Candidatus Omnitrophota bacterium]|nr:hypothetical protein [Candidatus Omnitrophota bacterium]
MSIFQNKRKFVECSFSREDELEKTVIDNHKIFFGKNTIYIDAKKKIEAKALGGAIPDGFLFDFSDKDNPEFYIVEMELSSHDFYKHIFPQITKFFSFYKNPKSQDDLIEKIFTVVNSYKDLKKEFKKYLIEKEIYKFIKDVVENSQNILLLLDEDMPELPEIIETYSDTWGKMVKKLILKKFIYNNEVVYFLDPEFENIEYAYLEDSVKREIREESKYSEEYHLEDVTKEVKGAYSKIKCELHKLNKNLIFNPTKYYISIVHKRSIAYLVFRRKKIRLTVMLPEEVVRKRVKFHSVAHISDSVQRYWGGPSCDLIIENSNNFNEIIQILKSLLV